MDLLASGVLGAPEPWAECTPRATGSWRD